MKSFSIFAVVAALAMTTNAADQLKAKCTITNAAGDRTGNIVLAQDYDLDEMVAIGDATVTFRQSGLDANQILSLKIFDNQGEGSCAAATSVAYDLVEMKACPNGNMGVRNLVNRQIDVDS